MHGENDYYILEQSIDADKVVELAADRPQTNITISLTPLNWLWLGVAIDLLELNPWLLYTGDKDIAHEQIMQAMGALMPLTYIVKLTLGNNEVAYLRDKEATLLTPNKNEAFRFQDTPLWQEIYNRFNPESIIFIQVE